MATALDQEARAPEDPRRNCKGRAGMNTPRNTRAMRIAIFVIVVAVVFFVVFRP